MNPGVAAKGQEGGVLGALFGGPSGAPLGAPRDKPLSAPARLQVLRKTGLLSGDPEERFDRLTRLAAHTLRAPVSLVSLVTDTEQIFKSCFGLKGVAGAERRTPLSYSFCQHAVTSGEPLIIRNSREHPLVKDNPSIEALGVVAYAGIPLILESGEVIGSFCVIDGKPRDWSEAEISILRDLAASAMTEINLESAREKAESANKAKDRFLAILSHELRMPLSPSLMIVASMVDDSALPPSVREDARIVQRNIEQQTQLIDDLLDITRIENGKLAIRNERVDLHEVVSQSAAACNADPKARVVAVRLDLRATRPAVRGDANRLRQVFHNLLRNALKFTPAGGEVVIGTQDTEAGTVRITVRDTGIGIGDDILPTLFEPFAQGLRSRTDEHGGLGLGLAICRGIVEGHGGTIRAQSDGENEGTEMSVELPSLEPLPASAASQSPPAATGPETVKQTAAPEPSKPVSILLVDDHEDTLHAMSRLLRRLEHRVVTANCVQGAMRAADSENFDLLISDVGLPDGTGLDLMRHLIGRQPIRGIALTGYGSDQDLRQTREAGFSAHLTKPIDFHALESAIRSVADGNN